MTYKEKMKQANREAKAALVALVIIAAAWAVLGFGLEDSGIVVFSTPLWIVGGCLGTWIVALSAAAILSRFVMKDIPLEDEED